MSGAAAASAAHYPPGIVVAEVVGGAPDLAPLTFPHYRKHLLAPAPERIAVAARRGSEPIGLALLAPSQHPGAAELLSLCVSYDLRRQGIGSALLEASLARAAAAGFRAVLSYHSSRLPAVEGFEATLRKAGWSPPDPVNIRVMLRCGPMRTAMTEWPGMRRLLANPGIECVLWRDLASAEIARLQGLSGEPQCPESLRLDPWLAHIDADLSIGLRVKGEAVGWVLIALTDPTENGRSDAFCPAAYIRRDLWRSGSLVRGYLRAIERVAEARGTEARLRFSTSANLPGMHALTLRRFAPAVEWVDELRRCSIEIFPRLCAVSHQRVSDCDIFD